MKKRTTSQWLHLLLNTVIFCLATITLFYMASKQGTYMRPLKILSKHETGHDHKSHHYTDYYLTVQWQDREKEKETFKTQGETFVDVKVGEEWNFRRSTEFRENYGMWLVIGSVALLFLCALSGIQALDNRGIFKS